MPAAAHTASVHYSAVCYQLTLQHTSSGGGPAASPGSSTGCAAGYYIVGEQITLTAAPAQNYHVASWSGTDNNSSTSLTNLLTMPASNKTVTVNYALTCYSLTRTHTGSGGDPTAYPINSSGCLTGQYISGTTISLQSSPAMGFSVGSWSGTDNDASTSLDNSLTMLAGNRTATVNYTASCYNLTLTHSGNGSDPTATPANSIGCPAGRYVSGAVVTLSAFPAEYHHVALLVGNEQQ